MLRIASLILLILPLGLLAQTEVSFEPKENFEFELDYQFKSKPIPDKNEISLDGSAKSYTTTLLPYVKIKFDFTNFPPEYYRMKITGNRNFAVKKKKLKKPKVLELDLGFAEDIKDGIVANRYVIYFENKGKENLSFILINIEEDGSFYVNEELHGKF